MICRCLEILFFLTQNTSSKLSILYLHVVDLQQGMVPFSGFEAFLFDLLSFQKLSTQIYVLNIPIAGMFSRMISFELVRQGARLAV